MTLYRKILVTTDFSEEALPAVKEAARILHELDAEGVLVYVVEDREPPLIDQKSWEQIQKSHRQQARISLSKYAEEHLAGCRAETSIEMGAPHRGILEAAERHEADLIVISTEGHSRLGHALLGSTVDRVLRGAECPVLVVRPTGP